MHGDLAQPAAAGYHDGKNRASVRNYPPSGGGGEKEGRQTESAAISDDERKKNEGVRARYHTGARGRVSRPRSTRAQRLRKLSEKES